MIPRRPLLALAALAAISACASSQNGYATDGLVGCWYFEQDQTARALNLPWGVRLTADSLTGWPPLERPGVRVAITLVDEDQTADHPFGYWRTLPGDSVRIGYPGMGGFSVDLAVVDGALAGTARPVGDAGVDPDRTAHPVRLQRARCPDGDA